MKKSELRTIIKEEIKRVLKEAQIPGLKEKVQEVLPKAGGKLKLSSSQLVTLTRAVAISMLDKNELSTAAKKVTVPEYAADFISAYNQVVDVVNKPKITKADLVHLEKSGPFSELRTLANRCDNSPNIPAAKFGMKLFDALFAHPRNLPGL